jgi:serine protease Do
MKTILKSGFILALALTVSQVFAQNKLKSQRDENKSEDIIIRKKGNSNEKLTIVIDGDKVTVNGKPVDDYKSDDVEITHSDDMLSSLAFAGPTGMGRNFNMLRDDLMSEIHSNKAFLGVMTKKSEEGAQITGVTKESAAEKAGLKEGDIIIKINNDKITDANGLYKAIAKYKPQDKINVTYKRTGKESTVAVVLTENKGVRAYSWKNGDNDDFNFRMAPPSPVPFNNYFWGDKPRLGVEVQDTEDGKGVKVLDVDGDEAASKAGLKEDDIITQVNGKNITSVDDLEKNMKDVKKGDSLKITFLRNGTSQTAEIKFPKDLKTTDL